LLKINSKYLLIGSGNAFGKLSKCKRRRKRLTDSILTPPSPEGDMTGGYG